MTTRLDTKIKSKVIEVIDTYGKSVTYRRYSSSHDVDTGNVVQTTTDTAVKVSPPQGVTVDQMNRLGVKHGSQYVVIANEGVVTPTTDDALVIDSIVWRISTLEPYYSGDNIAAWALFMER